MVERYEIIVTDVTRYGSLYCVAGMDRQRQIMIRPEPMTARADLESSRFWPGVHAGPGRLFAAGHVVAFDAMRPSADFPFPHATEDRLVRMRPWPSLIARMAPGKLAAAAAGSISPTIEAAFDGGLVHIEGGKAHVEGGYEGRSLGAIELPPDAILFHENRFDPAKPKLRSLITDTVSCYDVGVTADAVLARWRADGMAALEADLDRSRRVHVRLGLARPFPETRCYLQINGLYFLQDEGNSAIG